MEAPAPVILAPADDALEAAALADAGALMLYCGYQPGMRPGAPALNRRTFAEAQVTTVEELRRMTAAARERGAGVWVTFNAAAYPVGLYGEVLRCMREALEAGADGCIVADPGLMRRALRENLGPLTLSTLAGVWNPSAVTFFRELGVRRMTLPRELSAAQIASLAGACPDTVFDAFVLFGACPNLESSCRWVHDDPRRVWPCVQEWRPAPASMTGPAARAAATQAGWSGRSRTWGCGLCAVRALGAIPNLGALKIVGRGAPLERKLLGVRLVRGLLESPQRRDGEAAFTRLARERHQESAGPCDPYLCLYPEYLP